MLSCNIVFGHFSHKKAEATGKIFAFLSYTKKMAFYNTTLTPGKN
jgi:hypothetical protein